MKKSGYGLSLRPNKVFFRSLVVALAVIFIWRGVWNLLDKFFLTDSFVVSNVVGIVIGLMLLYLPDGDIKELS